MARIVKAPDVRRSEILDVAQRLFYRNGYEQSSVQDIISEIGIAKGTFYHYFSSKQDLLDAMIERMIDQTLQAVEPIVNDNQLNALEKFTRFFAYVESWKIENGLLVLTDITLQGSDRDVLIDMEEAHLPAAGPQDDLVSALVHLGYSRHEAERGVEKAMKQGEGPFEELLRRTLRVLSGR